MNKVILRGDELVKTHDSVQMDASAIAKGLGVDVIAEMLESAEIENYMVDIGGEIRARGVNDKGLIWRVGIDKPVENSRVRELSAVVALAEGALATSGNYRNYRIQNGIKYGHIINPSTGFPVQQQVLSASVYAPSCMEADAYATAFMVMEAEQVLTLVSNHPRLEVYLICQKGDGGYEIRVSEGFGKMIIDTGD